MVESALLKLDNQEFDWRFGCLCGKGSLGKMLNHVREPAPVNDFEEVRL